VTAEFDRPPWYFVDFAMAIADDRLKDIYSHWQSIGEEGDVPRVDRFDPLDLIRHLGQLFIVRVEAGGAGDAEALLRYTLIGTKLVDVLGRDATGAVVDETFPADHPVGQVYRYLLIHRVPARTHGRLDWVDKEYRRFESVLLPLAEADGRISKILGAAVYL